MEQYNFNIPTRWEDITLKAFQDIKRLYAQYEGSTPPAYKLIALLSGEDETKIKEAQALVVEAVMEEMTFLVTPITDEISNKIEVDNTTYVINNEEKLRFGEFVDCNTVLEADNANLAAILGIVCRKEGELYNDDFIANTLDSRVSMYEQQSMDKIQPLINFFLNASTTSEQTIQSYLKALEVQTSHILEHYENSMKNGTGKRLFMSFQMMKLRKLKKQLKRICQQ